MSHSFSPIRKGLVSVVTVLVTTAGCGFVFVHGPPDDHMERASFSCTTSNVGPILDGLATGMFLFGAIGAAESGFEDAEQLTVGSLAYAGITGSAFVVGLKKTARCRKAREALRARQEGRDSVPADSAVGGGAP